MALAPVPAREQSSGRRPGLVARLLAALIRGYQLVISPWLGASCRFEPSCSAYGLEAMLTLGALRGSGLTLWRLARCQPFGTGGYDPVPAPRGRRGASSGAVAADTNSGQSSTRGGSVHSVPSGEGAHSC